MYDVPTRSLDFEKKTSWIALDELNIAEIDRIRDDSFKIVEHYSN